MPRDPNTALPQPIFSETSVSQDPTAFITPHPSDTAQFNALGNLLKKDVVSFDTSRVSPGDLWPERTARDGAAVQHDGGPPGQETGRSVEGLDAQGL
jgi:hypothetical protein